MTNADSANPSQCDTHGTKSLPLAESDTTDSVSELNAKETPVEEPMLLMHMDWSHLKWTPDPKMLNWSAFDKPSPGSSRCVTQGTENPTSIIGEYKPPPQPRISGTPEKTKTQRLMDMKWPPRGYEPGFISGGPADTIQKSSTFPLRMRRTIPSYGAAAFGGLCPNKEGGWSGCHVVSSRGNTAIPSDNPAAKLLQRKPVASSLCAVGRILDPVIGCYGSGFWIEGGYFVTGLHFAEWNTENKPTVEEINNFRYQAREFLVSCDTIAGSRKEPGDVSVYFEDVIVECDCAVFRSSDPNYRPRSWIPYEQLLDPEMVEILSLDLSKHFVFAAGYNCGDYEGLDEYLGAYKRAFRDQFQGAGGTLQVEPDYEQLLRHKRKTLSCGSIKKYDASPQIRVDCTCWKGYSGGPIFCILDGDRAVPVVIDMIGGLHGGFYTGGMQLPRGFAKYFRGTHPNQKLH
ncbi:hypothetical protein TWF173_003296 [Orbilia oligospora]|nr:hypothetical protein TWF173_003296 [Orbilia oligospora]